ncbi:hypothetical protein LUZ60_001912 [Juncus effusus]|nr:hypothetical protein LUZ60_001912 [Juncus effusus]
MLKVDFKKAFDSVSWPYLIHLLFSRGFPYRWINWIHNHLITSSSCIKVNGTLGPAFPHQKGLRQGDPLSPLIFNLVSDSLQQILHNLTPLLTSAAILALQSLQYADDTVIFIEAHPQNLKIISLALELFAEMSGLQVNWAKSGFTPIAIPDQFIPLIENILRCNRQFFPIKYLAPALTSIKIHHRFSLIRDSNPLFSLQTLHLPPHILSLPPSLQMAPIPMKQSTQSSALVREAVTRATLATSADQIQPADVRCGPPLIELGAGLGTDRVLCWEEVGGRKWRYEVDSDRSGKSGSRSVKAVSLQTPVHPAEEIMSFVRSYVVPEGFPDSVTPSYVPYMTWRALKHFFGGAMGVLTTQALLRSIGVCQKAAPGAVAINWILKDGAGRVGKMIFSRQGKKFDYDLKQLRFAADLLLEIGAGVELATAAAPHLFLPMACAANVAKNVAAVTSTSTRTPIYKSYARAENIGDVTAKGECVGNVADLMGTGLSILISKRSPSLVTTFAVLSCGYLLSSYQEVKSVVLNTLNRARFTVAVDSFIKTGYVPSLQQGNSMENIFSPPWVKHTDVVLGSRFGEAFQEPNSYVAVKPLFESERYMITYNPSKDKIFALLKDQAKSDDILKAAYHAHVLLHFVNSTNAKKNSSDQMKQNNFDYLNHIAESCKVVSNSYGLFKNKAKEQGWIMSESLLNPGRARICGLKEL